MCIPIFGLIKISGSIFVDFFSCLKFICKNSIGLQLSVLCLSWGCCPVHLLSYGHRERALLWGLHRVLDTFGSLTGAGVKPEANPSGIRLGLALQLAEPVALDPQPQTNFPSLGWVMEASLQGLQVGLWHPELHLLRCHTDLTRYPLPWHCWYFLQALSALLSKIQCP